MPTMKPSTVLKRARKLVEKGWCKGPYATDKNGNEVDKYSKQAVCFCPAGASDRICGTNADLANDCFTRLDEAGAISYSDSRFSKATLLKRIDIAIARAAREGR